MTHTINELSFGHKGEARQIYHKFGEKMNNELDGLHIEQSRYIQMAQMHAEYVVDITEAEFEDTTETYWEGSLEKHPMYSGF